MERNLTQSVDDFSRRPARLLTLVASLLAGVATALALMPSVFRSTPTDISRIGVLLEALRDAPEQPEIVVFGNSIVMSGIDAAQLGAELPDHPRAWNLASTGQSLVESAMITQELPDSARVVIYAMPLRPNVPEAPLHPQKGNAYYLYGFRPTDETLNVLSRIYGTQLTDLLTRSHLAQVFEARWAVRQLLDTQLRVLLRSDLSLASAKTDLFHPQRYTVPIAAKLLERVLEADLSALRDTPAAIPEPDLVLARALARRAELDGRHAVFFVPPLHPVLRAAHQAAFARAVGELSRALGDAPNAIAIDASAVLDTSHFIDDRHPTDAGAEILTAFVAKRIAESF